MRFVTNRAELSPQASPEEALISNPPSQNRIQATQWRRIEGRELNTSMV